MSAMAVRLKFDPVRTLAYTSITTVLAAVGTELAHPARSIYIFNNTDRELAFSFDGINDNIILPSFGYWFFDIASNQAHQQGFYLAEGESLYARTITTNPTQGSAYFTVMYGQAS